MAVTLYDASGNKIDLGALKKEQASPTTRAVRRSDAFHPAAGLTPGKLANLLRDSIDGDPEAYLALAEDMEERNEHYAGVLGTRKRQVVSLDISVEAAGEDAKAVEAADLVRKVINRDAFQTELIDILDALGKGFSATEIVWDTSEKQWRPKQLCWRDPRCFTFDQDTREIPMFRSHSGLEPLNPYGWIWHQSKMKSGLPIRGGLARGVAWTFLFKSFSLKDWAIFCEAYGQPLRLGKYGPSATEDDKAELLRAVANIGVDYAAIVPENMLIDIVQAQISGNHEHYEKRADWMDRQVSKLVLGQTGTTDAIAGGHAVGKVHDEVRQDIEKADANQLAATLNRDLVVPLVSLNLGPQKAYPKIKIERPDQVDVEKLVTNVAKMVPFGLKVGAATMREIIGLPEPQKDEELLVAPRAAQPNSDDEQIEDDEEEETRQTANSRTRPDDSIETAINEMLGDEGWEPLVGPIVEELEAELATATNIEEAKAILNRRVQTLGVAAFTDLLARSAFAARLAGEAGEDIQD